MKTLNTAYLGELDVLRAFAAFGVLVWHYIHFNEVVPYRVHPLGLSLLEEGHVGVSLFMVLSGYLFAKIVVDKHVDWSRFFYNRVVRIVPLLLLIQMIWLVAGTLGIVDMDGWTLLAGLILPVWIGGAWSIAVELHFYILLPLIKRVFEQRSVVVLLTFLVFLCLRQWLMMDRQDLLYATILGRIDQFLIGFALYMVGDRVPRWLALVVFVAFLAYFELFNLGGGLMAFELGSNALVSPYVPHWTIEGIGFAALIILVLRLPPHFKTGRIWRYGEYLGQISYSIYLWHYVLLVGFGWLTARLGLGSGHYLLLMPVYLAAVLGVSAVSYRWIELFFLKRRIKYVS